jgi:hypothetical protein
MIAAKMHGVGQATSSRAGHATDHKLPVAGEGSPFLASVNRTGSSVLPLPLLIGASVSLESFNENLQSQRQAPPVLVLASS